MKKLAVKIVLRIVTLLVLIGALAVGAWYARAQIFKVTVAKKHALVEQELQEVAELTLYKMRYSDIATIKKKKLTAKAYSIVRYVGTVRAGIRDISAAQIFISDDGKTIDVILPRSEILGNDITSQEVFDEQRSIFLPITMQEIFDEIDAAREQMEQDLLAEGLLDESDERAAQLVTRLLERLGFTEITVVTERESPLPQRFSDALNMLQ